MSHRGAVCRADLGLPGNVSLPADVSDCRTTRSQTITQVAAIDREALTDRVGHLPDWLLEQVGNGLRMTLGL